MWDEILCCCTESIRLSVTSFQSQRRRNAWQSSGRSLAEIPLCSDIACFYIYCPCFAPLLHCGMGGGGNRLLTIIASQTIEQEMPYAAGSARSTGRESAQSHDQRRPLSQTGPRSIEGPSRAGSAVDGRESGLSCVISPDDLLNKSSAWNIANGHFLFYAVESKWHQPPEERTNALTQSKPRDTAKNMTSIVDKL